MRFVSKSKIGRLSAKKGKIYAQIRLPPQFADTIGEVADVFETELNAKRAFLLVTKQSVLDDGKVLQHSEKVVKPADEIDNDQRLDALESQIAELKSIILSNESSCPHKNETNGLGRIRTGDLRLHTAEDLAFFEAFSVGDITVRKANDPSHMV
jgi:mRNA-degrading endonuclease RelE of RelBE toxin-antitoxin system